MNEIIEKQDAQNEVNENEQITSDEFQSITGITLQDLETERAELLDELKLLESYIRQNPKMENGRFKEIQAQKAEVKTNLAEVETEIKLINGSIQDGKIHDPTNNTEKSK
jgi:hypothetical protein